MWHNFFTTLAVLLYSGIQKPLLNIILAMRITVTLIFCTLLVSNAKAQVPVSDEPRHHPVFQNDKVRLLNVLLPPGDTTQYHVHATPSVFIMFTATKTGSQRINEQPEYSTSAPGKVWYEDLSEPHIKVHRVWNSDTSVFHVMDIELLAKEASFITNPEPIPHAQLQIDAPWAMVYKVHLEKNEVFGLRNQISNFVLVAIDSSEVKGQQNGQPLETLIKPGQFYWIKTNDRFLMSNQSMTPIEFILVSVR